jgi:hypothetical protein
MTITPVVRGLYLCEQITVHPSSNLTLHECFRTLKVAGLPTAARPFVVVAYLANGQGDVPATIRVRRLDTLAEVYRAETPLHFADRLAEVRLVGRINRCVFPGPGQYEVSLWVGGELLTQTPFTVQPLGEDLP